MLGKIDWDERTDLGLVRTHRAPTGYKLKVPAIESQQGGKLMRPNGLISIQLLTGQ